jgi:hypothetical protein
VHANGGMRPESGPTSFRTITMSHMCTVSLEAVVLRVMGSGFVIWLALSCFCMRAARPNGQQHVVRVPLCENPYGESSSSKE